MAMEEKKKPSRTIERDEESDALGLELAKQMQLLAAEINIAANIPMLSPESEIALMSSPELENTDNPSLARLKRKLWLRIVKRATQSPVFDLDSRVRDLLLQGAARMSSRRLTEVFEDKKLVSKIIHENVPSAAWKTGKRPTVPPLQYVYGQKSDNLSDEEDEDANDAMTKKLPQKKRRLSTDFDINHDKKRNRKKIPGSSGKRRRREAPKEPEGLASIESMPLMPPLPIMPPLSAPALPSLSELNRQLDEHASLLDPNVPGEWMAARTVPIWSVWQKKENAQDNRELLLRLGAGDGDEEEEEESAEDYNDNIRHRRRRTARGWNYADSDYEYEDDEDEDEDEDDDDDEYAEPGDSRADKDGTFKVSHYQAAAISRLKGQRKTVPKRTRMPVKHFYEDYLRNQGSRKTGDGSASENMELDLRRTVKSQKEQAKLLKKYMPRPTFFETLMGDVDNKWQTTFIRSPTARELVLKPFIRRDYTTKTLRMRLHEELLTRFYGPDGFERIPIDYCYLRPQLVPAVNALLCQHFWPGIDSTQYSKNLFIVAKPNSFIPVIESLDYPQHTVVVLYNKMVIGCGFISPRGYITYLLVHTDWQRHKIASYMLYHLIQTCITQDITLHVSVGNTPALLLYQKFCFKVEERIINFYDKYVDPQDPESEFVQKDAFFMRLRR